MDKEKIEENISNLKKVEPKSEKDMDTKINDTGQNSSKDSGNIPVPKAGKGEQVVAENGGGAPVNKKTQAVDTTTEKKNSSVPEIEKPVNNTTLDLKSSSIENKSNSIENMSNSIEKKSDSIENKSNNIENKNKGIENKSNNIENESNNIENKSNNIENGSNNIEKMSNCIENKSNNIENKSKNIENESNNIENGSNNIENMNNGVENKSNSIGNKKGGNTNPTGVSSEENVIVNKGDTSKDTAKNNNKESSEDKTHVPSKPRKKHINNTQDSNISNESDTKETIQTLPDIINPEIEKVILGKCSFENLPPLPKKVVRIFISSTFTDTQAERNALMQHVYPKLSDYCREKHGLEFQVVDMRWGVPEQASDNHSTSELCIQEIKKCQEVSVGPNFVALVGDKYGYRPIPSEVDEKVFKALQQVAKEIPSGEIKWNVVEEWYNIDHNAVPSVYLLQQISSKLLHYNEKENQELRKESQNQWNQINQDLTVALRKTSELAFKNGSISEKEQDQFFISVTENEIAEGIFWAKQKQEESHFCIIRKIEDLELHVSKPKAPRFTDLDMSTKSFDKEARNLLKKLQEEKLHKYVTNKSLLKLDIEWKISGADITIQEVENVPDKNEQMINEDNTMKKHQEYIDGVCNSFFQSLSSKINEGNLKQKNLYDPLTSELLQHWHLARNRCEIFEGRDEELNRIHAYLINKSAGSPLIVHGSSGCGKTSVMAKVMENIITKTWTECGNFVVAPRFLGTTPNTSNLHQLLVSLCIQLCGMYKLEWEEPEKLKDLILKFHSLLDNATADSPLVIILDSIDQLMPAYNAFKLKWLPEKTSANAKLLLSTIDEGYPIFKCFEERYKGNDYIEIQIHPLGEKLGLQVIKKWLGRDNRTMTEQQEGLIKEILLKCSLPLYARIAYDQIKRWKSYDIPAISELEPTVRGAINKLFLSMEDKLGKPIVAYSLSYLTASRHGLSEAELEHILSLDDSLLNEIFKHWRPPVRRIPPLLWTRVRTEIHSYIVERSADDVIVLNWYHRQFIEATKARYLSDSAFSTHISDHLAQFFSGKWGGGKAKPFEYTEAQVKRFGLIDSKSAEDRKAPNQPYVTEYVSDGKQEFRFNSRKLSELPFHLIKTKDYQALKTNVFFSYSWLYSKLKSSSVQQLLEEFEIFMQADKVMKKDPEMKILYANLQLMRPCLHKYPNSLTYELMGRLARYIGKSSSITNLIRDCDSTGIKTCPFVPLITCFETADVGFSQNIQFRSTESWVEGRGGICCSNDFKTMYIMDYNDDGSPAVLSYDIETGEKINILNVTRKDEGTVNMYSKAILSTNGKELITFYKQQPGGKIQKKNRDRFGLIDTIDLETGNVIQTFDNYIYLRLFENAFQYMTENYICVDFVDKTSVIKFRTDTKKDLNKPTLLSADEKSFIVCGREKTVLREFATKAQLGEFDVTVPQMGVGGNGDLSLVVMVESTPNWTIRLFDASNKAIRAETESTTNRLIKCKKLVQITDDKMRKTVEGLFSQPVINETDGNENPDEINAIKKCRNFASVKISPTEDSFMVIFGYKWWMAYLYSKNVSTATTWGVKCIRAISPKMFKDQKYPQYSNDGKYVILFNENKVSIISTLTAMVVNEYEMAENIRDFCVSPLSDKLAVMLAKSVLILAIEVNEEIQMNSKQQNKDEPSTNTNQVASAANSGLGAKLNPQLQLKQAINERISAYHKNVALLLPSQEFTAQPELLVKQVNEKLVLEEVLSPAAYVDTDRIASARSKRKHAVYKTFSPSGLRAIHYHSKVQVVDTKNEVIKYTPKKEDVIMRTAATGASVAAATAAAAAVTNETIQIPGLDDAGGRKIEFILQEGDRIMNLNKIRYRVQQQEVVGQYKIMNVPSVLSVYSVQQKMETKLHRLQSITVFGESILSVSNNYIVTTKKTSLGYFINVYKQDDGKLLATHQGKYEAQYARFVNDEAQLFVVDAGLTLTCYLAPLFNALEIKIPMKPEVSILYSIKDIITFEENKDILVISYGSEKPSLFAEKMYMRVNHVTKEVSNEMVISPAFDDISANGSLGIDGSLQVYDLEKGIVSIQLPYTSIKKQLIKPESQAVTTLDTTGMHLTARFCLSDTHIVFIDKDDDTLHLASLNGGTAQHIFSCMCHVPDMLLNNGFSVVNSGKNLILRRKSDIVCLAIVMNSEEEFSEKPLLSYTSEQSRALSVMIAWGKSEKPNVRINTDMFNQSRFLKRKVLVQQMKDGMKNEEQPVKKEFQIDSPDKPQVLVISGSILSQYFDPAWFSKYLKTEKISVSNADAALIKLNSQGKNYDVIILQLITDDVTPNGVVDTSVEKVSAVIESGRTKARMVLLSLAPIRGDGKEINDKTQQVNAKLVEKYKPMKDVHICDNKNLSDKERPIEQYFQDGVHLSAAGVKQISVNYREAIFPLLSEHYWVGQKHNPHRRPVGTGNKVI